MLSVFNRMFHFVCITHVFQNAGYTCVCAMDQTWAMWGRNPGGLSWTLPRKNSADQTEDTPRGLWAEEEVTSEFLPSKASAGVWPPRQAGKGWGWQWRTKEPRSPGVFEGEPCRRAPSPQHAVWTRSMICCRGGCQGLLVTTFSKASHPRGLWGEERRAGPIMEIPHAPHGDPEPPSACRDQHVCWSTSVARNGVHAARKPV